ncbi:MAG: N-acetyl-gamma-glutamyl-phosphate reductase [Peptococcaceae bacterium]|jgi:N-acetyl-gamma-glutamyl-phosphate reductase|nr:N-acetyl-gamma-glutamyl-phosphate reductase [Peptococcaceae bacterium]
MKVGILGATGYTGQELLRLLNNHPEAEIVYLGSSSSAGKDIAVVYPHLSGCDYILEDECIPQLDVLFVALPHGIAAGRIEPLLNRGIKVIDLGADFRLKDSLEYEKWYKVKHANPRIISEAVYGLPELYRKRIYGKCLVANPGCFPTASLLALVPLLEAGLIQKNTIVIDAKSGVSGAGRGVNQAMHFSEVNENFKAYGVAEHRHTPEIEQQLSFAAQDRVYISFVPHLVPMTRGIMATIYAQAADGSGTEEQKEKTFRECLKEAYQGERFVHLLPEGVWPQTKYCYGSNHAFLQLKYDAHTGRVIIVSVIDNLVKGASGQAVQNMNILFGLPEAMGLETRGMWP